MGRTIVEQDRIDAAALRDALIAAGRVDESSTLLAVKQRPIGIGHTADTLHVTLTWSRQGEGPDTLVAKIPSADARSARTAASLGAYEREARFYAELGSRTQLSLPSFYGVLDFDGRPEGVLLEDLSGLSTADQLSGIPVDTVRRLRQELVALQAPFWQDPGTAEIPWLHRRLGVPIPGIIERMAGSWATSRAYLANDFDVEERDVIDRFVAGAGRWAEQVDGPYSLTHHDFRVDNVLFGADRIVVLDWQTVGWGAPMFDVAYLLGTSVDAVTRRSIEREEVALHVQELDAAGVTWSFDEAWTAYRMAAFAVLLMLVPPTGSVKRTDRGDTMFRHLLRQGARMALDLDADEFLSEGDQ